MTAPLSRGPVLSMQGPASTEELLQFERLVSALSAAFINMPPAKIDAAIADALQRIVEALRVDRSTLSIVVRDSDWLETYHSWAVEGVTPVPKGVLPLALPWALARARAGLPIVFSRLEDLPREATIEREWYGRHGLRSHVGLPVIVAGELIAILGFGVLHSERTWSSDLLDRLKLVAEIFGAALARKRAYEDVQRALGFERLLVDISAEFFRARYPHIDNAIRCALRAIGEFLKVERATLWTLPEARSRFVATHAWPETCDVHSSISAEEALLSSKFDEIVQGALVSVSSTDGLQASRGMGGSDAPPRESILVVPLMSEHVVLGVMSLFASHEPRAWEDALTPRVRLIGELFASLLNRQRAAHEIRLAQSETAQFRERLAHLARVHTVDEMSAAIAHEVNQPLMAVENYAQAGVQRLTRPEVIDRDKLQALFGKISTQAARAGSVLERLRSIVKRHESEVSQFDLGALVVDTMNLVEMESRLKDVQVEVSVPPTLLWVLADEIQIQQVLVNLARNGVDAMEEVSVSQKVLRIEAILKGERELAVRVMDQGRGISDRDALHLFEPFYTTKQKGLGIGLAICRSIVEAHGGRLEHWPNDGRGTVFEFTLPTSPVDL